MAKGVSTREPAKSENSISRTSKHLRPADSVESDAAFKVRLFKELDKFRHPLHETKVRQAATKAVEHYIQHGDYTLLANLVVKSDIRDRKSVMDIVAQALRAADRGHGLRGNTAPEIIIRVNQLVVRVNEVASSPGFRNVDAKANIIEAVNKLASNGDWTVLQNHLMAQPIIKRIELIELVYRSAGEILEAEASKVPELPALVKKALKLHWKELNGDNAFKNIASTINPDDADFVNAIGRATWRSITTGNSTTLRHVLTLSRHADRKRYAAFALDLLKVSKRKSHTLFKKHPSNSVALETMLNAIDEAERSSYGLYRERVIRDNVLWRDGRDPVREQALEVEFTRAERAMVAKDRATFSSTFSKSNGRLFVQGGAPSLSKRR